MRNFSNIFQQVDLKKQAEEDRQFARQLNHFNLNNLNLNQMELEKEHQMPKNHNFGLGQKTSNQRSRLTGLCKSITQNDTQGLYKRNY